MISINFNCRAHFLKIKKGVFSFITFPPCCVWVVVGFSWLRMDWFRRCGFIITCGKKYIKHKSVEYTSKRKSRVVARLPTTTGRKLRNGRDAIRHLQLDDNNTLGKVSLFFLNLILFQ
jgi:hypothetical protein